MLRFYASDSRVTSWEEDMLGRGTADAWSDVDLLAIVAHEHREAVMDGWRSTLETIAPIVFFNRLPWAPVLNAITEDWLRIDLQVSAPTETFNPDAPVLKVRHVTKTFRIRKADTLMEQLMGGGTTRAIRRAKSAWPRVPVFENTRCRWVFTVARARLLAAPKPRLRPWSSTIACAQNWRAIADVPSPLPLSEITTWGQWASRPSSASRQCALWKVTSTTVTSLSRSSAMRALIGKCRGTGFAGPLALPP